MPTQIHDIFKEKQVKAHRIPQQRQSKQTVISDGSGYPEIFNSSLTNVQSINNLSSTNRPAATKPVKAQH